MDLRVGSSLIWQVFLPLLQVNEALETFLMTTLLRKGREQLISEVKGHRSLLFLLHHVHSRQGRPSLLICLWVATWTVLYHGQPQTQTGFYLTALGKNSNNFRLWSCCHYDIMSAQNMMTTV